MQSILQLVPSLPPETGGVGDYALALANELSRAHAISTSFLVGKPSWQGNPQLDGFAVARVESRTPESLARAIDQSGASVVLLQLSGYGYDPNGCPAWVVDGLEVWKQRTKGRLVTMVHETFAFGWPWRKAFWLSLRQRSILGRIARISDGLITNINLYRRSLESLDQRKVNHIRCLGVFSNVGEPAIVTPLRDRARRAVVFGAVATRLKTYGSGRRKLLKILDALEIEEVVDIGPTISNMPRSLGGRSVSQFGVLPRAEIGDLMRDSVVGFVNYFPSYEAKSSVFAAYCSHGMLPVTLDPHGSPEDGLLPGKQYWYGGESKLSWSQAQRVATEAVNWYSKHNLTAHASAFAFELDACRESQDAASDRYTPMQTNRKRVDEESAVSD